MPCLSFRNVPEGVEWKPEACDRLYLEVAVFADTTVEHVEVHVEDTRYKVLRPNGILDPNHGVHVVVEWFAGRTQEAKDLIASAIDYFLEAHGLDREDDITFRDYPAGSFYLNGERVAGGPLQRDEMVEKLIVELGMDGSSASLLRYMVRTWHEGHTNEPAWFELVEKIRCSYSGVWYAFYGYCAGYCAGWWGAYGS